MGENGKTSNTEQIANNRYGGPESARSELTSVLDEDYEGAVYVASDSAAEYYWTGSEWRKHSVVSGARNSKITVFEDEDGTPWAVTEDETFTGSDVLDAAQQAIDAQLEKFSRDGGSEDRSETIPGNVHVRIKPGVYYPETGLRIVGDDGEKYQGVESILIEGSGTNYGTYLMTGDISGEPVIRLDANVRNDSEASDRFRGVVVRNLFCNNKQEKDLFDEAGPAPRDIKGIEIAQCLESAVRNVKLKGYSIGLDVRNCWEGHYHSIRPVGCGRADRSLPAIRVSRETDTDQTRQAARAVNHIKFSLLRGGAGCEYAYFEATDNVDHCSIEFASCELDCPGFRLGTGDTNNGGNFELDNLDLIGTGPHLVLNGTGDYTVTGGRFVAREGPWLQCGTDGAASWVNVDNVHVVGDAGSDIVENFTSYLWINNSRFVDGLRAIAAGEPNSPNWNGDGEPFPFNVVVSNSTIQRTRKSGVYLENNFKKFNWKVSGCQILDTCRSGEGNPVTLAGGGPGYYEITDNQLGVNGDVSPRPGVTMSPFTESVKVRGNTAQSDANVTRIVERETDNVGLWENYGTATVPGGSTSMTVAHSLVRAPDPGEIEITPTSGLGAAGHWYVDAIDASSFDLRLDTDPGQDVTFGWQVEL